MQSNNLTSIDTIEQEIRIKHGELSELYNKRNSLVMGKNQPVIRRSKKTNLKNIDFSTIDLTLND